MGHDHFSANFDFAVVGNHAGNSFYVERIDGDVFSFYSVSASERTHEFSFAVEDRHPESIKFEVDHIFQISLDFEDIADALFEIGDIGAVVGVVERNHRCEVLRFLELSRKQHIDF